MSLLRLLGWCPRSLSPAISSGTICHFKDSNFGVHSALVRSLAGVEYVTSENKTKPTFTNSVAPLGYITEAVHIC